ncbi:MAG: valine--tRNA ligase [Firmicutes bacterium]|nr:valine--tRNA ligase [Bacillota bacterium]
MAEATETKRGVSAAGKEIPTVYDPHAVEAKWYKIWEESGYFHAEVDKSKPPFSIVIPPPNITGELHLGHAMDETMQDILIRWKRMQGYNTTWIPGMDHAGIATQARVEEHLRKTEGKSRYDLGREQFIERVWQWKEEYGGRILRQLRRLGVSCDWERERFTMDEGCSRAVREVFVELYKRGLIYQGDYIINWCPRCRTALSDIEVEHEDTHGRLWYVKYPLADDPGQYIMVATTRPETMLGDTAVAVNPKDERYQHLVGKKCILPLLGRELPIIADDYVDMEFGTGVVKITPAHDPNDFEVGQRHNLEAVLVLDGDAKITEAGGKYFGMDRYEARQAIIEDLESQGLLEKTEEHQHAVGACTRCDHTVEPLLSKQWFVKMKPLAEPAIAAVESGDTRFVPERFSKNYLNWMREVRDWCISRQLWWGHRIPVWHCACGEMIVAKEDPTSCPECGSTELRQDPDVLDTWFSSALWPFSTLGWPEKTEDLEHFYPTSVLVTGFDIIFFWVARMMVMGLEFMGDVPFGDVLIHGLVRDSQGRKMSKSLGNGVDPIEVIDEFGADALRFSLMIGTTPGNDTRYRREKVEAYRNFANKIWNASRFALMNLGDFQPSDIQESELELSLPDKWILSRYQGVIRETTRWLDRFDLGEAARALYDFIWTELCDWYVEMIKPHLYGRLGETAKRTSQYVLWKVLEGTLRLLHPFMPFITEEIWQHLPHEGETIMLASWPAVEEGYMDQDAEAQMEAVMEMVRAIRNIRGEKKVSPGREIPAIIHADEEGLALLEETNGYLKALARVGDLKLAPLGEAKPEKAVTAVAGGVEIYLPLAGLVDLDQEIARLRKELEATGQEIARAQGKLADEGFVKKAPAEIVEKEREKLAALKEKEAMLQGRLRELVD